MSGSREQPAPTGRADCDRFQPPTPSEAELKYEPVPPPGPRGPRQHARRHIPIVPTGLDIPDHEPEAPLQHVSLRAFAPISDPAPDDLVIAQQSLLLAAADNGSASQVCEPSLAVNGDVVFMTGNWFAAVSLDGGQTFRYTDPATAFANPPGMRFCCDQIVHYIEQIDMFVWLLQYMINEEGKNLQRLAFATTDDVRRGNWWTTDITTEGMGIDGSFLDFPDLAVGKNALYMSTNSFRRSAGLFDDFEWACSIVIRMPYTGLRSGKIEAETVMSDENFNFRVAQHCDDRVYWATHADTSTLRVYSWHDDVESAAFFDVPVATWVGGNGFLSETPDGFNWLRRIDPRVLGAAKAGDILYFAWSVDRGGANERPHPHIQIARVNTLNMMLLNNISIWDREAATAYPALTSNAAREVGCSYFIGGGNRYPSHALSLLTRTRKDIIAAEGLRGPTQQRWGDFVTIRRHYPHTRLFAASGYVLRSGSGEQDATANYTVFGRREDVEAVNG